jgi:hypothetical protein
MVIVIWAPVGMTPLIQHFSFTPILIYVGWEKTTPHTEVTG